MPEALWPHFSGNPSNAFVLVPSSSRLRVMSAGLLDLRRFAGMRPLTPLSRTPLPLRAHVTFVRGLESTCVPLWFRATLVGRKSEEPAKTTIATVP